MTTADDRGLEDVLERLRTRFYGKYRGTVNDVDSYTLRIRAMVPAVLGRTPTGWCLPCVPYAGDRSGCIFFPDGSASVWIEFEGGDVSLPDLGRRLLARRRSVPRTPPRT